VREVVEVVWCRDSRVDAKDLLMEDTSGGSGRWCSSTPEFKEDREGGDGRVDEGGCDVEVDRESWTGEEEIDPETSEVHVALRE
jgi:hypothetical protein